MSHKQFCDKCNVEITKIKSACINGIDDAEENGTGNITFQADLCIGCYEKVLKFIESK